MTESTTLYANTLYKVFSGLNRYSKTFRPKRLFSFVFSVVYMPPLFYKELFSFVLSLNNPYIIYIGKKLYSTTLYSYRTFCNNAATPCLH